MATAERDSDAHTNVFRPYGVARQSAPTRNPYPTLLVAGGTAAILVALPMTALTAFGWGFMVGGGEFLAMAAKVLASLTLIPCGLLFLFFRANWFSGMTLLFAVIGLLLAILCWVQRLFNLDVLWGVVDTLGTAVVAIGATWRTHWPHQGSAVPNPQAQ
jgi:hypothetical protein